MSIFNSIQSLFINTIDNTFKYFQENKQKTEIKENKQNKQKTEEFSLIEVEIVKFARIEGDDL